MEGLRMFMLSKTIFAFFIVALSFNLWAVEERVEVIVKKTELVSADPKIKINAEELFALKGIRQAITAELVKKDLDSEVFWNKIEEKKLSDKEEIDLFKPFFSVYNMAMLGSPIAPVNPAVPTAPPAAADPFQRASFVYDLDQTKIKDFFDEVLLEMPDVSIKTFYILPGIELAEEMNWIDVGVAKEENFSGVIIDSWKKWAATQFKNFPNIVVLKKDFLARPEKLNPESVTLKWNSTIKKGEVFQDRKSAQFELVAQYVLVNTKTNQSFLAYDFPTQKREVLIANPKDLSSTLASLVFNMLNSQTSKINSSLELNRASSTLNIVDVKVTGKHGLFDITQINSFLAERFKEVGLTTELKSYSSDASVISIKSTLTTEALYAAFLKDGGKLPLNEQKILLFSPESKTFAIIPKEANN